MLFEQFVTVNNACPCFSRNYPISWVDKADIVLDFGEAPTSRHTPGCLRQNTVQRFLRTAINAVKLLSHKHTASKKLILSLNYLAVSVSPCIVTTREAGDTGCVIHSPSLFFLKTTKQNNVLLLLVYVLVYKCAKAQMWNWEADLCLRCLLLPFLWVPRIIRLVRQIYLYLTRPSIRNLKIAIMTDGDVCLVAWFRWGLIT